MEEDVIMTPVGVLMVEHLLIERMMDLMERKLGGIKPETKPDMVFVDGVMDFAKTYADVCHHGKEERIFFDKLAMKNLLPEHKQVMDELVLEHIQARKIVANLEIAREDFMKGDPGASQRILTICKSVWQIYPGHMAKEEKVFFPPAAIWSKALARPGLQKISPAFGARPSIVNSSPLTASRSWCCTLRCQK